MLPPRGTFYSIPVVAVIIGRDSVTALITGASDGGLHRFRRCGLGELRLWSHPLGARAMNSGPVVDGNLVYASHGQENEDTNEQGSRHLRGRVPSCRQQARMLVWKVKPHQSGLLKRPSFWTAASCLRRQKAKLYAAFR